MTIVLSIQGWLAAAMIGAHGGSYIEISAIALTFVFLVY